MRAIILTKSAMKSHGVSGVCTTAFDLESNRILRLVSNELGGPIPPPYNQYYECMDIVDAEIIKHCPIGPQQENVLVKLSSIKKLSHAEIAIDEIYRKYLSTIKSEPLYMNDTFNKLDSVEIYNHSLELLKVKDLIIMNNEWNTTKAEFTSCEGIPKHYRFFSVKDPNYVLAQGSNKAEHIDEAYIVVSIPYDSYIDNSGTNKGYYKLIAAIYPIA